MSEPFTIPSHVTHYYSSGRPFQTLTDLSRAQRTRIVKNLELPVHDPRLWSDFYFEQRIRYEAIMYEQFVAKGGRPSRRHPHYAALGTSDIWSEITKHEIRLPLGELPPWAISFTWTDSWDTYIGLDPEGNAIPGKPLIGMLFRLDELEELFDVHGPQLELYTEAQIWSDEPLAAYL